MMAQFWRIVQVVKRLTAGWEAPFTIYDLLLAYTAKLEANHDTTSSQSTEGLVTWFKQLRSTTASRRQAAPSADSATKVERLLEFSFKERSLFTIRTTADWDEEDDDVQYVGTSIASPAKEGEEEREEEESDEETPEKEMTVGSTPMKPTTGLSKREALAQLARKGREIKRKASPTSGSGVKNPKTVLKEPSSKSSSPKATVSEKAKTPQVVDADPISQAPPDGVEG
ncbi:hypothetical protein L6452_02455 [Arctium lappa]|uniref:Uncharacterized protein n=1 Tax=Arctium lappa TaxID=4217 RepID=A0ACB9FIW9_ARCLA|nr:hypothetical protein L6452_02455 [Arctium lappa]